MLVKLCLTASAFLLLHFKEAPFFLTARKFRKLSAEQNCNSEDSQNPDGAARDYRSSFTLMGRPLSPSVFSPADCDYSPPSPVLTSGDAPAYEWPADALQNSPDSQIFNPVQALHEPAYRPSSPPYTPDAAVVPAAAPAPAPAPVAEPVEEYNAEDVVEDADEEPFFNAAWIVRNNPHPERKVELKAIVHFMTLYWRRRFGSPEYPRWTIIPYNAVEQVYGIDWKERKEIVLDEDVARQMLKATEISLGLEEDLDFSSDDGAVVSQTINHWRSDLDKLHYQVIPAHIRTHMAKRDSQLSQLGHDTYWSPKNTLNYGEIFSLLHILVNRVNEERHHRNPEASEFPHPQLADESIKKAMRAAGFIVDGNPGEADREGAMAENIVVDSGGPSENRVVVEMTDRVLIRVIDACRQWVRAELNRELRWDTLRWAVANWAGASWATPAGTWFWSDDYERVIL